MASGCGKTAGSHKDRMAPLQSKYLWFPSPPRTYYLGTGAFKGPLRTCYLGTWGARGCSWIPGEAWDGPSAPDLQAGPSSWELLDKAVYTIGRNDWATGVGVSELSDNIICDMIYNIV